MSSCSFVIAAQKVNVDCLSNNLTFGIVYTKCISIIGNQFIVQSYYNNLHEHIFLPVLSNWRWVGEMKLDSPEPKEAIKTENSCSWFKCD